MSAAACELCSSDVDVSSFVVSGIPEPSAENTAFVCRSCRGQLEDPKQPDANHWRALQESIWSESAAVKVLAWRVLTRLASEGWAQDLLQQLDLEGELLDWARQGSDSAPRVAIRDSNGTVLAAGDAVVLIKDLDVKGAGFTAKRGTVVKNIVLTGDVGLIEGRVNGTQIVLKTCFLKKQS